MDDDDYGNITQFASAAGGNYSGRMRFIAGGTETLNLVGGKVGIGQAWSSGTPAVELDIKAATPQIRLTSTDNNLSQGESIGQIGWYTTDPTTPGGAGTVSYINTFSANGNGADYSTQIFNRDGSAGGSTYIQLGNAAGAITFGTNTAGNGGVERLRIFNSGKVCIRSQGATLSDGYAALEIRQNTGGKHLVLATNSATSSTNEVMLGFKLHPSGQDERVKGGII